MPNCVNWGGAPNGLSGADRGDEAAGRGTDHLGTYPSPTPIRYACSVLYLLIEELRDAEAVYRRLCEEGRQVPPGLTYVVSWVTPDLTRAYQVMETSDRALLEQWMSTWEDLIDFEVVPVITSAEAQARTST